MQTRPLEVIKRVSCSNQLSMEFILLINVKLPTIVISRINTLYFRVLKQDFFLLFSILMFKCCSVKLGMKKCCNLEATGHISVLFSSLYNKMCDDSSFR